MIIVETDLSLYKTDLMRNYELTGLARPAGGLTIGCRGLSWHFRFLHAALDLENGTVNKLPLKLQHTHSDAYHIVLFTKASGARFLLNGKYIHAARGTLVLTHPGQAHTFVATGADSTVYSEVTFSFVDDSGKPLALAFHDLLGAFAGHKFSPAPEPLTADPRQESEIMALLTRMMDRLETGDRFAELSARQVVAELFVLLIREFYSAAAPLPQGRAGLAAAKALIEARYREPLTIAALAGAARMSEGYFQRAFRKACGTSPVAYQAGLRIEAARTLLRFSDMPCKTIAAHLGYSDVYHFSRAFRKATGTPPAAFRHRSSASGKPVNPHIS